MDSPPGTLASTHAPSAIAADAENGKKLYTTGTLRYTARGLFVLFLWLLWGDFAFTFFEAIFGRFIPLYLKDLQASNTLIGVMTGSFAGLVNIFFLPNISQYSDSYRSRWGRRIPFLYVVTPLTVGSLVLVGFAPEIGAWLHHHLLIHVSGGISETAVVLTLLCFFVVSFHFFNMVLVSAYNWLLRDVVPLELMTRFLAWFRIVGTVSTFLFLWFVFPHLITHRREICAGVGLFYLVSFLAMCSQVKEGEYPPPPPKQNGPGVLGSFALYFRDCLSIPLYRNFFITFSLVVLASSCAGPFAVLFARKSLGLDMDILGQIFAWGMAISALVYYPMAWLCEKLAPIRVAILALVVSALFSVLACVLVHDKQSFFAYTLLWAAPSVGWSLASMAVTMKLFPSEKFGQFSSALNVFGCGAMIPGNFLIGNFIDFLHGDYRMTFLWSTAFFAMAIIPMVAVYRGWKAHGGPAHYVPPLPREQPVEIGNDGKNTGVPF